MNATAKPATTRESPTTHVQHIDIPEEQRAYARILGWGCRASLVVMFLAYVPYVTGLTEPHVPLAEIPYYWTLPVTEYLRQSGTPSGWGWVTLLHCGDMMNFVPVAMLATLSMVCYAGILPIFVRQKNRVMFWITLVELGVLLLAASGLLKLMM